MRLQKFSAAREQRVTVRSKNPPSPITVASVTPQSSATTAETVRSRLAAGVTTVVMTVAAGRYISPQLSLTASCSTAELVWLTGVPTVPERSFSETTPCHSVWSTAR